jgi:hypothetical protein
VGGVILWGLSGWGAGRVGVVEVGRKSWVEF